MSNIYLVCYDVADDKRLRKVFQTLKGFGDSLQYSVFRCELSPRQRQALREKLWEMINVSTDRVMIIDLGPSGARGDECIEYWGEPRTQPEGRDAVVI